MKKIFKLVTLVATFALASSAFAGNQTEFAYAASVPGHSELDGNQTEFAYAA